MGYALTLKNRVSSRFTLTPQASTLLIVEDEEEHGHRSSFESLSSQASDGIGQKHIDSFKLKSLAHIKRLANEKRTRRPLLRLPSTKEEDDDEDSDNNGN